MSGTLKPSIASEDPQRRPDQLQRRPDQLQRRPDDDDPPMYAWDWFGRQRLAWREVRDRLAADPAGADAPRARRPPPPVPDWAPDLPDASRDVRRRSTADSTTGATATGVPDRRDYAALDTRPDVVAALREDYPRDPRIRGTVDTVIAERAFLGRLDVQLADRGVRAAPRGMRWWWQHLGGVPDAATAPDGRGPSTPSGDESRDEGGGSMPPQLRLFDVKAGYGDGLVRDDDGPTPGH